MHPLPNIAKGVDGEPAPKSVVVKPKYQAADLTTPEGIKELQRAMGMPENMITGTWDKEASKPYVKKYQEANKELGVDSYVGPKVLEHVNKKNKAAFDVANAEYEKNSTPEKVIEKPLDQRANTQINPLNTTNKGGPPKETITDENVINAETNTPNIATGQGAKAGVNVYGNRGNFKDSWVDNGDHLLQTKTYDNGSVETVKHWGLNPQATTLDGKVINPQSPEALARQGTSTTTIIQQGNNKQTNANQNNNQNNNRLNRQNEKNKNIVNQVKTAVVGDRRSGPLFQNPQLEKAIEIARDPNAAIPEFNTIHDARQFHRAVKSAKSILNREARQIAHDKYVANREANKIAEIRAKTAQRLNRTVPNAAINKDGANATSNSNNGNNLSISNLKDKISNINTNVPAIKTDVVKSAEQLKAEEAARNNALIEAKPEEVTAANAAANAAAAEEAAAAAKKKETPVITSDDVVVEPAPTLSPEQIEEAARIEKEKATTVDPNTVIKDAKANNITVDPNTVIKDAKQFGGYTRAYQNAVRKYADGGDIEEDDYNSPTRPKDVNITGTLKQSSYNPNYDTSINSTWANPINKNAPTAGKYALPKNPNVLKSATGETLVTDTSKFYGSKPTPPENPANTKKSDEAPYWDHTKLNVYGNDMQNKANMYPVMYNVGKSLFDKPEVQNPIYNKQDVAYLQAMKNNHITANMDPLNNNQMMMNQAIRSNARGSGQLLSAMQANANASSKAANEEQYRVKNTNQTIDNNYLTALNQVGANRREIDTLVEEKNRQHRLSFDKFQRDALESGEKAQINKGQMLNQELADKMTMDGYLNQVGKNFKYVKQANGSYIIEFEDFSGNKRRMDSRQTKQSLEAFTTGEKERLATETAKANAAAEKEKANQATYKAEADAKNAAAIEQGKIDKATAEKKAAADKLQYQQDVAIAAAKLIEDKKIADAEAEAAAKKGTKQNGGQIKTNKFGGYTFRRKTF